MIRKISTKKTWKNVLLKTGTQQNLDDVMEWLNQSKRQKRTRTKNRKQKPSMKLLFYGAPKRVKQTVAALRGQEADQAVYRIDIPQVISKYNSETEQDLEQLFSNAQTGFYFLTKLMHCLENTRVQ